MIEVKICGINDLAAIDAALDAGADVVGLVFFPPSPRAVTMDLAAKLAARARGRALVAALTVNADDGLLADIVDHAKPDLLQLHGEESTARVSAIRTRFARPPKDASRPGGHGRAFDWTLLAGLARKKPMMLSGGLTPENIAEAIRVVRPNAVDVSSGVEHAPGAKDAEKIRDFVKNARAAAAALGDLPKREKVS